MMIWVEEACVDFYTVWGMEGAKDENYNKILGIIN